MRTVALSLVLLHLGCNAEYVVKRTVLEDAKAAPRDHYSVAVPAMRDGDVPVFLRADRYRSQTKLQSERSVRDHESQWRSVACFCSVGQRC